MTPKVLRVASLDCDIPVPNVYAERGTYSDIFEALLRKAKKTELRDVVNADELELEVKAYNAVRGELPRDDELNGIDGIIVTGSGSSAYDNVPWIKNAIEFCQSEYAESLFSQC